MAPKVATNKVSVQILGAMDRASSAPRVAQVNPLLTRAAPYRSMIRPAKGNDTMLASAKTSKILPNWAGSSCNASLNEGMREAQVPKLAPAIAKVEITA